MGAVTAALLMYCFSATVANVAMGISGFGSGIIMVLGWQVANMLSLDGVVPFEHVQVLLVAMALPTATFLTCRSWHSNAIDVPVCLTFGVFNLCFYAGGLLLLLHVLIQSPVVLKHALGCLFLVFALLRIASDLRLIPGSGSSELRPRGEHPPLLMVGWAITGAVSGAMSGIFGVGGPPTMLFMTMARMDKGAMRGTNQAGNIALQLVRIGMLLSTGVLKPTAPGVGLELFGLVFAGIVGAIIGDQLHGSVSDRTVVRIILVLLLMGSASMIIDLKSGSYGAHIMVGAMACITLGSIVIFTAHHFWLRCTGGTNDAKGGGTARTTRRTSVPIGASLYDRLLFDVVPYRHVATQSKRSDNSGRDMRLLI